MRHGEAACISDSGVNKPLKPHMHANFRGHDAADRGDSRKSRDAGGPGQRWCGATVAVPSRLPLKKPRTSPPSQSPSGTSLKEARHPVFPGPGLGGVGVTADP